MSSMFPLGMSPSTVSLVVPGTRLMTAPTVDRCPVYRLDALLIWVYIYLQLIHISFGGKEKSTL